MAAKDFTPKDVEVVLAGLEMLEKSLTRRIVAETDADAKAVWQGKKDAALAVAAKVRSK